MHCLIFLILSFLVLLSTVLSFAPLSSSLLVSTRAILPSSALNAKAKANLNPNNYWEGEWICADCGYIYDRDVDGGGLFFEELKRGFICPQCSAPRKRYAKKVGDQWGVTRDGGDLPIYATTIAGLALTTWFALYYVPTL